MKSKVWQSSQADNPVWLYRRFRCRKHVRAGTLICILGTHRIAGNEEADVCLTLATANADSPQICKTCPRLEQRRSTARICDDLTTVRPIHPTSSWPTPIRKAYTQQLDQFVGPVCLNCGGKRHNFMSAPNHKATTIRRTDLGSHHRPGQHGSACQKRPCLWALDSRY